MNQQDTAPQGNLEQQAPALNPTPDAQPNTETQVPSADLEKEQLKKHVAFLEQWRNDATRMLSSAQLNGHGGVENRNHFLQALSTNPQQTIAQLVDLEIANRQYQQAMVNEYSQRYPDLAPFQDSIRLEAGRLFQEAQRQGVPMTDRDAIEKAAQLFQSRLQHYQQQSRQQAQVDDMKKLALKFNVGATGQRPATSLGEALSAIPSDDDAAFARLKKQYLRQKGISQY